MRIAMFGTFDIGNFGDLLFPIVAEKKLGLGEGELDRYSYRHMDRTAWYYDVLPVQEFPHRAERYDLALIGGGHLVHFVSEMAEGYRPTDPAVPHPLGFWWLPAVGARAMGMNVATHAISCDAHLPGSADALLAAFVDSADYLTVRDPASQARLDAHRTTGAPVEVVPDSVFSIPDIIRRGAPSPSFDAFRRTTGLHDKYIVVQPSYSLRRFEAQVLDLAHAAKARGWEVLELPIGFGIGNDIGFYTESHGFKKVETWPEPLLLAEIIANAQAAVGISLHLSVVASSYGIPVYRPSYTRESKFIALDGLPNIRFFEKGGVFEGADDGPADLSVARAHAAALEAHWKRLRDLAQRPGTVRAMPGYWDMLGKSAGMATTDVPLSDRIRTLGTTLRARRGRLSRKLQRRIRNLKPVR